MFYSSMPHSKGNSMKKFLALGIIFLLNMPSLAKANDASDAVVKILVASNKMDYYHPWQSQGITPSVGSGVVIANNQILTNAHVVANETFVQVKKESDPKKYTARVVAVGDDCDLALLSVDDEQFFKDTKPLTLGGLPKLQDAVIVIGYPQGGEKISITEGVVSRIEVTPYAQSSKQLLTVQIDAAINPGNSGGPVVQDGKLVGIAMQYLQTSQNIGYIIPSPIIDHFLNDLKDGHYDGFPLLGIDFNSAFNEAMRRYYKVDKQEGGVLVTKVLPFSPAEGILKEGDLVLSIDKTSINEDGTFKFRGPEGLMLTHLVTQKQMGDTLPIKLIRDGEKMDVSVTLKPFRMLVPPPQSFDKPSFYIHGGLVFTILSTDLLSSWGGRWWEQGPLDLNYYLIGSGRLNEKKRKDVVVLLNVLPDDINVGYHDYDNEVVARVNGQEVKSFKDFIMLLQDIKSKEPYTIIETEHNFKIILNNDRIDEINAGILKRNNIPQPYSQDVAGWFKEGK